MDYTAPYAKERLTGRGYFTPTGSVAGVDLGNVDMFKVDFGIKRKEHFSARRGIVTLDRQDAYGSQAVWTMTLDEFVSPLLAYAWGGTANANTAQGAQTGATVTFTTASKKGGTFDIAKFGLFNASLTTPASKTEGYNADYVIDRAGGKLYIPLTSTIADGTTLIVTYSCPALTFDNVTALNVLNRPGTLEVQAEDDSGQNIGAAADAVPPLRYVITVPCILSIDDSGDFKNDDYRKITVKAVATASMTVKRLQ
jgi:hypothetical protein